VGSNDTYAVAVVAVARLEDALDRVVIERLLAEVRLARCFLHRLRRQRWRTEINTRQMQEIGSGRRAQAAALSG
jgi:hypothetical protein